MNNQTVKVKPNSEGQDRFLKSEAPRLAGVAGIGGGKTFAAAIKSFLLCRANKGIMGYVTAPTYKIMNGATIPMYKEIFDWIPGYAHFVGGDSPEARLSDGGKILFRSTDKPDTLRGPTAGFVHMDEAAAGSNHYSFNVLLGRLRQKNPKGGFFPCQLFISTSPKGLDWIYTEFVMQDRADFELVTWSTKDNQDNLPPEYYNTLMAQYKGKFAEQELEGKFLLLQGDCMFDVPNLERTLKEDCRPPKEILEHGLVSMWKEPVVGRKYVMGADCAARGGGGMNCAVILDEFGEECVEIWGEVAEDTYAELMDKYGRIYNNALAGVEVNATAGGWIVNTLKKLDYPKMYRRKVEHNLHHTVEVEQEYGWYTGINRETILTAYKIAVNRNQTRIYNAEAIKEMRSFISKPSGKWEATDGCFDDRVMARAIAWRMRQEKQGMGSVIRSVKRLVTTC